MTAAAAATVTNSENTASEKKQTKKNKKKSKEPLSEVENKKNEELGQGDYTIDYESLRDALSKSFSLDESLGDVHFAPLIGKTKKFEKAPKFSISSSSVNGGSDSRNSNMSSPSAKS